MLRHTVLVLAIGLTLGQAVNEEHATDVSEKIHERALLRCPREPICDFPCVHGYLEDDRGCPTCNCKDAPDKPDDAAPMPCPVPMCAHQCKYGYRKDDNGCETCDCAEGARKMTGGLEDVGCPQFKCELEHCDFGLERDALGCHLCSCADDPCEQKECSSSEMCQLEREDPACSGSLCDMAPVCMAKSLCHHHRSMHDQGRYMDKDEMLAAMGLLTPRNRPVSYMPQCKDDGRFEPRQCDKDGEDCFCVDDRGQEINATRVRLVDNAQGPVCEDVHTTAVQMKFKLWHDLQDLESELEHLKQAVEEHVSNWFSVQVEYVTVVEISPDTGSVKMLFIETIVMHDGRTDLPTASLHVHDRMHRKQCDIPYKETMLRPDPTSLQMSHKYDKPRLPDHGLRERPVHDWVTFCKAHQTAVIVGCAGGSFILIMVAAVVIHAAHRKRGFAQFQHQKMTSNYKKNLVIADEVLGQGNLTGDDKVAIINHAETTSEARESVA